MSDNIPAEVPAPAADAPAGSGKPGEALKWRIDVEDYVSEDNASVVDSIIEEIQARKEAELNEEKAAAEEAAAQAAAAVAEESSDSTLSTAASAAVAASAAAAVAASAESPPSHTPAQAAAAFENPMVPPQRVTSTTSDMSASTYASTSNFAPPTELSQLYASLKATRDRVVTNPEELEQKNQEIAMLQQALKQVRSRTTSATSASSAATSSYAPSATTELTKTPSAGYALRPTPMDGTTSMRRVASEGPPEGVYSGLGMPFSPADDAMSYRGDDARSVAGYSTAGSGMRPPPMMRTQTNMSSSARSRNGGESYRAPPGSARGAPLARDPRFDPRQTVGFSEAQARAMGLIQGAPTGHSEAKAEDVAHMNWKAHSMSRAPSMAGRSYAGSVRDGFGDDSGSVISDAPWGDRKSRNDAASVYGDNRSVYGDNRSVYGDNKSVYGDARSVYGDETNAIVPAGAAVTVSPWRNQEMPVALYKNQEIETVDPIVDHSDAYSTVSGAYFRAPPEKTGAPSEAGDMQLALTYSRSDMAPKSANKSLSRRLGQLTLLGDEGVTMPDTPEPPPEDTKSVKSIVSMPAQPPPPAPVGTLDLQMFNKLVKEMREEGQNIQKLKQQNKLLQGWYADAKAWADEKSLRAWEAMSIADDAEDVAAMKHKMLKELDSKLQNLKERMAGITMLEQENRMLRQKIHQMTTTKAPDSILQSLKNGPRPELIANLLAGSHKDGKHDLDALQNWMEDLKEDGSQVEHLKKLNRLLQGWYADANSRAEDSIAREREEFKRAKEAEELAAAGDLLLLEMEAKHSEMRMKLAARQMLEQENRELRSKMIALSSSKGPNVPVQKQQAVLLEYVKENMGYSKGRPVMACLVYKAMVHWSMIEVERLNTFDAVMEIQDQACRQANPDIHCYWLSNAVHMLFLATRGPTRIDSSVAKTQLAAKTERLYITIRDNVKGQLTSILNNLLQPPPVPMDDNMSEVGSVVSGANTTVLHKLVPSAGNVRRQMTVMWENVIGALRQLVDVMRANYVPPLVVRELLGQLLEFVDFKLFNNIMMHSPWVPCTLTNGETLDAGLSDLEDWLVNVDEWLNSSLEDTISLSSSLIENVKHVKQTTTFLLDTNKAKRSLRSIQKLCPDLSMTQLAHICTWFEDDREGMPGVEPAVIEQMWALMHEEQPFLLKEDKSCPFSAEEVTRSMREFTMDDIEPPAELKKEASFHFLIPAGIAPPELNPEPVPGVNESNVPLMIR